jgi:DNA modification methylase
MKTNNLFPTLETSVLHLGDNLEAIRKYPNNSVDVIITDAPYGLNTKIHSVQELAKKYLKGKRSISPV